MPVIIPITTIIALKTITQREAFREYNFSTLIEMMMVVFYSCKRRLFKKMSKTKRIIKLKSKKNRKNIQCKQLKL